MGELAWPLKQNRIRRDMTNHTFGMVRNGGSRPHQGWDLYATPGTNIYAIADGKIADIYDEAKDGYKPLGTAIYFRFEHKGEYYYAVYSHLKNIYVEKDQTVVRGQVIGQTGNTGNARSMTGEDQHLHFEIRTALYPGRGLAGRIDPKFLYPRIPIGCTILDHGLDRYSRGPLCE